MCILVRDSLTIFLDIVQLKVMWPIHEKKYFDQRNSMRQIVVKLILHRRKFVVE